MNKKIDCTSTVRLICGIYSLLISTAPQLLFAHAGTDRSGCDLYLQYLFLVSHCLFRAASKAIVIFMVSVSLGIIVLHLDAKRQSDPFFFFFCEKLRIGQQTLKARFFSFIHSFINKQCLSFVIFVHKQC